MSSGGTEEIVLDVEKQYHVVVHVVVMHHAAEGGEGSVLGTSIAELTVSCQSTQRTSVGTMSLYAALGMARAWRGNCMGRSQLIDCMI